MRPASTDLNAALLGSFDAVYECDLFYGDVRVVQDLPVTDVRLDWDGSAQVEGSGSLTVLWSDVSGRSLRPLGPGDPLAPFGARLVLHMRVRVGGLDSRVQLGVFTVTSVPSAKDDLFPWDGRWLAASSTVQVTFQDRSVETLRDRFTRLTAPKFVSSVYAELAHLTGFQVKRSTVDAVIPRSVVYEQDRLKAVRDVASIVGGVPFMDSDGTLAVRTAADTVVGSLTVGETGTVVEVGSELDSEGVYNGVVITGETDGQTAVLAELWVSEGPLKATTSLSGRTPYHRVPRMFSSPFITTQAQAVAAAPGLLARFSQATASQLVVSCVINPLYQIGDVVTVTDSDIVWTVRVQKLSYTGAVMRVTGDVLGRQLVGFVPVAGDPVVVGADPSEFGLGVYGVGVFGR